MVFRAPISPSTFFFFITPFQYFLATWLTSSKKNVGSWVSLNPFYRGKPGISIIKFFNCTGELTVLSECLNLLSHIFNALVQTLACT